jgi:hypothetical protein
MVNKLKNFRKKISELSADDLTTFRDWFAKFDADAWDRQIESDIQAGKLDKFAAKVLSEHKRVESHEL